jgi:hypothetical protein
MSPPLKQISHFFFFCGVFFFFFFTFFFFFLSAVSSLLAMLKNEDGVTEATSRELDALSQQYAFSSDALQAAQSVDARTLDALRLLIDPDDSDDIGDTGGTQPAVAMTTAARQRVLSGTHSSASSPATSAHLTTSYDSSAVDVASTSALYATMPINMTISSTTSPLRRGSDPRDTTSSSDSGPVSESVLKFEASVAAIMSSIMNFVPASHVRTYASRALPTPVAPGSPFIKSHRDRDTSVPPNAAPASPVVQHRSAAAAAAAAAVAAASHAPLSPISSPPLSPRRQRCERCGLPNGRTITPYINEPSSDWRCLCLQCSLLLNSAVPEAPPPMPMPVETEFESVPPLPPLPHNWSEMQM